MHFLLRLWGADLRSLALMRIGMAFTILVDLAGRAGDLEAHYTDLGVLPRADLIRVCEEPLWVSLHMISGQGPVQALLFLLAAAAAVALLVGWRTRWASVLCWAMLCSLQVRNPLILNSGDGLFRLILMWGIFLPWGRRWSLDARGQEPGPDWVVSAGTAAYVLQMISLYLAAGLHKTGEPWWNGTALYYALHLEELARPAGHWLLQFPALLSFLSYATVFFQRSFPLLLLCPVGRTFFRGAAALGSCLFHLGIALCMDVGVFSLVAFSASLGLLPSGVWRSPSAPPEAAPQPRSVLTAGLIALLAASGLVWNVANLAPRTPVPQPLRVLVKVAHLDQFWGMFAPRPLDVDGWFVAVGKLENGKEVDLRTQDVVSWDKPESVRALYRNERWRKYLTSLYEPGSPHRALYCQYLAGCWNRAHRGPWQVRTISLYFVRWNTPPPGQPDPAPQPIRLLYYELPPAPPRRGLPALFAPEE